MVDYDSGTIVCRCFLISGLRILHQPCSRQVIRKSVWHSDLSPWMFLLVSYQDIRQWQKQKQTIYYSPGSHQGIRRQQSRYSAQEESAASRRRSLPHHSHDQALSSNEDGVHTRRTRENGRSRHLENSYFSTTSVD